MKKSEKDLLFSKRLLRWDALLNKRLMPWKGEQDPYRIWLSEIILQQTRVAQGLSYYNSFIEKYPTICDLAVADENEVFKLWEGLGYYSRCKNLLAAARQVCFEHAGNFPDSFAGIMSLPGVGPYTAAAISSFAFGLSYAVVDGNVSRVLARFFGIEIPVNSAAGKKYFSLLAQKLLGHNAPAKYNQAIMDFGAVICRPKLPLCADCPLQDLCTAFKRNIVDTLPVKEKAAPRKTRYFFYLLADYNGLLYVRKRTEKDIWQNLWEFANIEMETKISAEKFVKSRRFIEFIGDATVKKSSRLFRQQLTHRDVEAVFIEAALHAPLADKRFEAVRISKISKLAFPRVINDFLESRADV